MEYIHYPSRKAIFIGSPGHGSQYLKGVPIDLQTKRKFFKSETGGAWREEEIITLFNPSLKEVQSAVQQNPADYLYTYFSGHGYTTSDGEKMLCLKDSHIQDFALLNYSPRQLVVVDACRTFAGARISGVRLPEPRYYNFTGSPAREIFDNLIVNSPAGRLIVHSTRAGEPAKDGEQGGYFTQSLLKVVSRLVDYNEYQAFGIESLLPFVPAVLEEEGISQFPNITYREGNLMVPFCIRIPGAVAREPEVIQQPSYEQVATPNNSNGAIIGIGALALLAAAIFTSK